MATINTILVSATLSSLCYHIAATYVTIDTPSGRVKGALSPRTGNVTRFLAIPYAEPASRFERAKLLQRWEGKWKL